MRVVVDASLLVEALDPESEIAEDATDLRKRLASESVTAPALILWEIGNYVSRIAAKQNEENPAAAGHTLAGTTQDVVLDVPDGHHVGRVIALAVSHGLTFYDASYLELATREPDSYLVTQDERLRKAGEVELGRDRSLDIARARAVFKPRP